MNVRAILSAVLGVMLTYKDDSHDAEALHRLVGVEGENILRYQPKMAPNPPSRPFPILSRPPMPARTPNPSLDKKGGDTHEYIFSEMFTHSHVLVHTAHHHLQMVKDVPNIDFGEWRKVSDGGRAVRTSRKSSGCGRRRRGVRS